MDKAKFTNVLVFMERSTMTGKEAFAWVETYRAVEQQVVQLEALEQAVQHAQQETK